MRVRAFSPSVGDGLLFKSKPNVRKNDSSLMEGDLGLDRGLINVARAVV